MPSSISVHNEDSSIGTGRRTHVLVGLVQRNPAQLAGSGVGRAKHSLLDNLPSNEQSISVPWQQGKANALSYKNINQPEGQFSATKTTLVGNQQRHQAPEDMAREALMLAIKDIPASEKARILKAHVRECIRLLAEIAPPPLPEPDPSGKSYPLFQGVRQDGDVVEYLKKHPIWGPRLKAFNPELSRDWLFQDQLGQLDRTLLVALKSAYTKGWKKGKLSDLLPQEGVRTDLEREELSELGLDISSVTRVGNATNLRSWRAGHLSPK